MATHAPGGGAGELYISPYESVAGGTYGSPVEILRPYNLGTDRTKWFIEGDFNIASAGGQRELQNFENIKGIVAPWVDNNQLSRWQHTLSPETELTGRNQQFIPLRIKYKAPYGGREWKFSDGWLNRTGSRQTVNVPFIPNVQFKQGGKLNYINYFK